MSINPSIGCLFFNCVKLATDAAGNKNLKRIFLEENSLTCDSNLKEFKEDFLSARTSREETLIYKIIQPGDLRCSYPIEQAGKVKIKIILLKTDQISDLNRIIFAK